MFFFTCLSFCPRGGVGVWQTPALADTPWADPQADTPQTPPGRHPQADNPRGRHPPGRHTPPGRHHPPPPGRHHPPPGRYPPGRHPLGRHPREDTLPRQTPPPRQTLLQRTVRILLECILVVEMLSVSYIKWTLKQEMYFISDSIRITFSTYSTFKWG